MLSKQGVTQGGLTSWAKMMSLRGEGNSTGMPPDQICKQS